VPPGDPHRDVTGALHDVSNALTVLLGWVAEARSSRASGEQLSGEHLDRALAVVERRARVARDLARRAIGAHTPIDEHEEVVDSVVADVVEALSVEAQRGQVTLQVSVPCPGVRVPLAADLSQVLTNMVLNAIAWAPPSSCVVVDATLEGKGVAVVVQDEGPGVASAQASRIFDGTSNRKGGAGVGLKHARAIARAAGGELELVAGTGGPGARFRLRWPRAELPPPPLSAPRAAVLAGTRILVVEDDVDVATLLESALGARGAQVVVARNAAELAERALEEHDAALVDLSPIASDVRGAVEILRRGSPELVLVFISGSATGLPDGLEGHAIRWVRKPFEVGEIVAAISGTSKSEPPPRV
jgi:CheY-like chemotaxis protein